MISCDAFYKALKAESFDFFAGVPDSLLKNFCFYVADTVSKKEHIITANEGSAIGLASGYHFATGKFPVVYLQNSGLGNTVNPLLSLADQEVYSVPMLLIIGWRGEPGVKDEPQHKKQGRVMLPMLDAMEIPYSVIDQKSDVTAEVKKAAIHLREKSSAYVMAVREGTFADYKYKGDTAGAGTLSREAAIDLILDVLQANDVVVATTGKTSRELYELRIKRGEKDRADFLTVGSMGHASQIALGVALQKPHKKVVCIDGDGALLMHMGGMATIGAQKPRNFIHLVINNGAHESVGGQGTGALEINIPAIAKALNYTHAWSLSDPAEIRAQLAKLPSDGPILIEIKTQQGSRKDLGRPKSTPLENKMQFMKAVQS